MLIHMVCGEVPQLMSLGIRKRLQSLSRVSAVAWGLGSLVKASRLVGADGWPWVSRIGQAARFTSHRISAAFQLCIHGSFSKGVSLTESIDS